MKLISVWGKGGVGKSTIASSISLLYNRKGFNTLLLSTDPTPASTRILCKKEVKTPTECDGVKIIELSEEDILSLWKKRFGDEVYNVISSFLPVDYSIIDYVSRAPGISDEFTLYYLYELFKSNEYDVIVWDTTGAGGSLNLLKIEKELYEHMGDAAKLYLKVRSTLEKLRKAQYEPLELINSWRELAKNIFDILSSNDHDLILVSEPTSLSFFVTKKILEDLNLHNIYTRLIIINKVFNEKICSNCNFIDELVKESKDSLNLFDSIKDIEKIIIPYIDNPEKRIENIIDIINEKNQKIF
ncbi:MAG: ArsA family ATPase [Caldisphaera sp.]